VQVVLSLLLNTLLLGGSVLWWSGVGTSGMLHGVAVRGGGARPLPKAAGFVACERAEIDEQKMREWGCTVFNKVCFDQVRRLAGVPQHWHAVRVA
jgi:hypothetical protein